jgi:hypothetical protein
MRKLTALLALIAAAGCAAEPKPAPAAKAEAPAFEMAGSRIIGCCCGAPCPCRLNKKPMQCHGCDHTDAVHIDRGHVGPVDMTGVNWIVVGRGFGEKTDANWVVVYLDEKATPAQEKALGDMLGGDLKAWGPKAKHLAGEFKGMKRVPMTYTVSADKREYAASIPGILDLRVHAHVNPGHKDPVVSTGIMDAFGDRFVHADCDKHVYKDAKLNYEWDLTGRQSNFAEFVLNPERVSKGAIGWGCWTAHSEYNDKEPYQEQLIGQEKK